MQRVFIWDAVINTGDTFYAKLVFAKGVELADDMLHFELVYSCTAGHMQPVCSASSAICAQDPKDKGARGKGCFDAHYLHGMRLASLYSGQTLLTMN